ncbi:PREDICTED: uncharacterized protein LOC104768103 [Camelina sativa]|uniref:Uncharacterized protein LOC104768103 n=1 Tax=Camelina sativa TaxID=90675 RepID=A0ABM1RBZ2_CAMSA|nr:PREDICTED: uncharacterized protein LOC104768103 [Camelina sativa]
MSTSSGETIAVTDSPSVLHVNMVNVTKLNHTNFLMWSRQVLALLDGYDLTGYVDGSLETPPPTNTVSGVATVNPEYKIWKHQDRLIYSALLGAMTDSVQPLLSNTTTSAEIWTTLSSIYATLSRSHIQQVKQHIDLWTKGDKSVEEYFHGLTTRFDQLAHLGKPMELDDKIEHILKGLPEDYRRVFDQLEGRESSPSLPEVLEKMINQENKLKAALVSSSSLPVTANAVHVRGGHNNRGQPRSNCCNHTSPRGYQGRCQISGIHGHSARRCSQLQLNGRQYSSLSLSLMPPVPWQPRAHLATAASSTTNNPWLLDSGATHHLTTDLNNLALHQLYNGGEEVTITDGSGLNISHTGDGSQNGGPVTPRPNKK